MKLKKVIIGIGIFILLLIGTIIAIPIVFKDQIKAVVDEQIAANVNADVLFDIDNFSLSLLPNFPNLTISIKELGVIGRGEFVGDELFAIDKFEVEINLSKLLFDDQMSIQGINLVNPKILIKVLEDGTANYDIAISTNEEVTDEAPTADDNFSIAIENWSISGGQVIYNDATIPVYLELENLNHSGSGNFSLSIFDLSTNTDVTIKQLSYDGDNYLSNRQFRADLILNMDLDEMKFVFKENTVALNEFSFGFDGWLAMPDDDISMDLTLASKDNSFKSLISLVPAIYSDDFSDLKSAGSLSFDGEIKGIYNETSLPAFKVNLAVDDGMFQYPDLPEAVSNVNIKMLIKNTDGVIDNTMIDISTFHIEFGSEPFDGYFKVDNLVEYPIDMGIKTTLDLKNLSNLFPTEGLDMKGILKADLKATGIYDSVNSIIPKIEAKIILENAEIIYSDLPAPLKNLNINASLTNQSGKLNDTKFAVSDFSMNLDGSPINGALSVENFDDFSWQAMLEGDLNFDKLFPIINKLYPMPGTLMKGHIFSTFNTEGKMSDVDNERYERLASSGAFTFDNFYYADSISLPQGIKISTGEFAFDPREMKVTSVNSTIGKSDFKVEGVISNYINYVFEDDATIIGQLSLSSSLLDLNELMTDSGASVEDSEAETGAYTVIEIPKNINFSFQANINKILYEEMVLNNAKGKIIIRDGILYLDRLSTATLGGNITFSGNYSTRDLKLPSFDMTLDVKGVDIKESYTTFNTVQSLAPIAKNIDGKVSTKFSLSGILGNDMTPDMKTINGKGLLSIKQAELGNSKLVSGITEYFKGSGANTLLLKDLAMYATIKDGKLNLKPFDMKINNYNANVGGSTDLEGNIDYAIKLDIPAGQLGSEANALLSSLTGNSNSSDIIKLNLGLGGTYDNPKVSLLGSDGIKKEVTKAVVSKAADLVKENTGLDLPTSKEELNKEAVAKAREEADNLLAEAQKQADQVKLEAKKTADKLRAEAKFQNENLMKEAGINPFKKTAAEIAGKKLMQEADNKANKIEAEGKKQSDKVMASAQEKADELIKKAENN